MKTENHNNQMMMIAVAAAAHLASLISTMTAWINTKKKNKNLNPLYQNMKKIMMNYEI